MSHDPNEDPRAAAVEQLERLGLSTYAARTFVALTALGSGTAKDVSDVSEVPRTRVYDAVDELQEHGLVDVRQSSPKEFWAISPTTARQQFERDLQNRVSVLQSALEAVEPRRRREKQRGVWTVDGQTAITDRILDFVADAEDEIVYMTVESLLTERVVDGLRTAAAADVDIKLGGLSPSVQERLQAELPDADLFDSLWVWSDTPAGRLVMVDRQRTLVSVLGDEGSGADDEGRSETAIWGSGETNSLVVVLKAIFTWRLNEADWTD